MKYVAFLRGINVGGHKLVKMNDLILLFNYMGFSNVQSVIASGNILFESDNDDEEYLVKGIEKNLQEYFAYEVTVLLRSSSEIQKMIVNEPFASFISKQNVKLYVIFLRAHEDIIAAIPQKSEKDGFEIVTYTKRNIYIVTYELPNGRFGNLSTIEKVIGKYWTTRNWNTILKIAKSIISK